MGRGVLRTVSDLLVRFSMGEWNGPKTAVRGLWGPATSQECFLVNGDGQKKSCWLQMKVERRRDIVCL